MTARNASDARTRGKAKTAEDSRTLPPPRRGMRLVQFDTFHEDDFEFFCDDLAGREPGIVSTDLKRGRGVAQYGVDVEAFDQRHRPVLVVSAKRYKKVAPADLRQWVAGRPDEQPATLTHIAA